MQATTRTQPGIFLFVFALGLVVLLKADPLQAAAGLLTGGVNKLEPLTLSVVRPLAKKPYDLESGKYYQIDIICDGSGEPALSGAGCFRNIWIDEVSINDIETRPLGIDSLEFDDEGTARIKFIATRPGSFMPSIPGSTGASQRATLNIR